MGGGVLTTPRLTPHARQRCAQMGISTKVAKRVVQNITTRYQGRDGRWMVTSNLYPQFMVILDDSDDPPLVITVLWKTSEPAVREGAGYRIKEPEV